jgi:hypothetical protein
MVKTQNIDTALLDEAIDNSGLKTNYIVEKLGISRQAFDKKRKGINAFRQSEVYVLCDLLRLSDTQGRDIFFPEKLG